MRKGKGMEARLRYGVPPVIENRNHRVVALKMTPAATVHEREAALDLLAELPGEQRKPVGGDKGYDTFDFVKACRSMKITPHMAMNDTRPGGSALDVRTTGHAGYAIGQRQRKKVEDCLGWMKTFGLMHKLRHRSTANVSGMFRLTATAGNIPRLKAYA